MNTIANIIAGIMMANTIATGCALVAVMIYAAIKAIK